MKIYLTHSKVRSLAVAYPDRIGWFINPTRSNGDLHGLPYVIDNGRFAVWYRGADWEEQQFMQTLEKYQEPQWVVCPDVVGDAVGTFKDWDRWHSRLSRVHGMTVALAAQDGMTPESIKSYCGTPDVVFLGGTTDWKRKNVYRFCHSFPRVHIGRVNYEKWLWNADASGAESCDGTGWFRGDQRQADGLTRYLDRSIKGLDSGQKKIEFSDCFK